MYKVTNVPAPRMTRQPQTYQFILKLASTNQFVIRCRVQKWGVDTRCKMAGVLPLDWPSEAQLRRSMVHNSSTTERDGVGWVSGCKKPPGQLSVRMRQRTAKTAYHYIKNTILYKVRNWHLYSERQLSLVDEGESILVVHRSAFILLGK